MASSRRRRCPIDATPSSRRSSAVNPHKTSPSISLSRNAGTYCWSPRPRSHSVTSIEVTRSGKSRSPLQPRRVILSSAAEGGLRAIREGVAGRAVMGMRLLPSGRCGAASGPSVCARRRLVSRWPRYGRGSNTPISDLPGLASERRKKELSKEQRKSTPYAGRCALQARPKAINWRCRNRCATWLQLCS